jgi:diketogulonate reductase-like aldo/keto reductase
MEFRELGKSGTRIPAIGLGTWHYHGGLVPLQTGIDLGASFLDTAEAYGTEDIIGQAIRMFSRRDIFVASKVSPRHFTYSDVIKSANESLLRLKTDYIDLYQLHWPNYTVPLEETMGAMETLVDQGKVRFIGVSNFMLRDLQNAQKAMRKHRIVANQVRYNLADRTIEGSLLQYCQQQQITIVAHSPLATNLGSIREMDPENVLGTLAEAQSKTVAQIVLNWCLSKPGIVTIPRSNSAEHVSENCLAGDFKLSAGELNRLNTRVSFRRRSFLEIVARRAVRHALQMVGRNQ